MARALLDGIVAVLFCVLVTVPAAMAGWFGSRAGWLPNVPLWRWGLVPPLILAFLVGLLLTAWAIRLLLPRLRPGRYRFPTDPHSVVWLLHFSLQRLMYLPVWRQFLFSFSTLRWALLRALGADAAFNMDASSDVLILDGPMIRLEPETMIGSGCTLSGHIIEHGTLILGPVRLARGAQIGNNVLIGPGTMVGEHAVIGPECRIAGESTIGPFAYLGAGCHLSGGTRIGTHAVVGHQVSAGPDVSIGEGAVIETGARIPRGAVILDGTHYPAATSGERV
jgi:acetyltransferase-like isoleucine patch superfamily enzyme